uniref:Early meiotic induction protein 1 n=1 Tax=Araucaria cunninghamii TaxID=56994 RepID=A0A0D6R752_ARACU
MSRAGAAIDVDGAAEGGLVDGAPAQVISRRNMSCTACFDALGFCYTPLYQMQQYYRYGKFDNCSDKWSALFDCLRLKTKPSTEMQAILESREKNQPHIWKFRTVEEASREWNNVYGHLNDD